MQNQTPEIAMMLIYLAVFVLLIALWWKIFTKAGKPGWGAIIPIYNVYLMIKVAGRPGWWLLLLLIPLLNIVIALVLYNDISKKFGKGFLFALGLLFLNIIFAPILAFGSAQYRS
ncbi:MAG: DUF5684 domain-containing protein [Desulfovibrionaceae bacterium]